MLWVDCTCFCFKFSFFFSENNLPTTCLEFALVSKFIPTQSGSCSFQSSRPWNEKIDAARKKIIKKEKLTLNVDHAGHWGIECLQEHHWRGNNETTKLSCYLGLLVVEIRNCCDLGKTKNKNKKYIYLFIYLFVYQFRTPQEGNC